MSILLVHANNKPATTSDAMTIPVIAPADSWAGLADLADLAFLGLAAAEEGDAEGDGVGNRLGRGVG